MNVDASKTDYLMGMLEVLAKHEEWKEPSLLQMTQKAIEMLKKNDKGYFWLVEGGNIDLGHHDMQFVPQYIGTKFHTTRALVCCLHWEWVKSM